MRQKQPDIIQNLSEDASKIHRLKKYNLFMLSVISDELRFFFEVILRHLGAKLVQTVGLTKPSCKFSRCSSELANLSAIPE